MELKLLDKSYLKGGKKSMVKNMFVAWIEK